MVAIDGFRRFDRTDHDATVLRNTATLPARGAGARRGAATGFRTRARGKVFRSGTDVVRRSCTPSPVYGGGLGWGKFSRGCPPSALRPPSPASGGRKVIGSARIRARFPSVRHHPAANVHVSRVGFAESLAAADRGVQ